MKKNALVSVTVVCSALMSGFFLADSNGNQPETPAVMKTSTTVTPPLNKMDAKGTPSLVVEFLSDRWDIQPSFKSNVDAFGKFLAANPTSQAEITAYADHTGHGPANVILAQKRADAVANYLMTTYAISANRIKAHGGGEISDKARNITVASRQIDRSAYGTITLLKP